MKGHKRLQVLGGALKPTKLYWYWVSFNWKGRKWGYIPLHKLKGGPRISTNYGERVTIRKYGPQKSHKVLIYLQ